MAVEGAEHLESVALRNMATGVVTQVAASGLYSFIGAQPASAWLPEQVARDQNGFVLTDVAAPAEARRPGGRACRTRPLWTECSPPATSGPAR